MSIELFKKIKEIGFVEPEAGYLGLVIVPVRTSEDAPGQEPQPLRFALPISEARNLLQVLQAALEAPERQKH